MPKGQTFEIAFNIADISIPGASINSINSINTQITSYGHKTTVEFFVSSQANSDDQILEKLQAAHILEAKLSLVNCYYSEKERQQSKIQLQGIICDKKILKQNSSIEVIDNPIYSSCYSITFFDRAYALWSQHKPAKLYTNSSYEEIISAQYFDGLQCNSELDAFFKTKKMIMINPYVSFYHYLISTIDQYSGTLLYNSQQDCYLITANKTAFDRKNNNHYYKNLIQQATVKLPNTQWHNLECLNSYAYSSDSQQEISNDAHATGIYQSHLTCTPIQQDFDNYIQNITAYFQNQQHQQDNHLTLEFDDYPNIDLLPGAIHHFNDYDWSQNDSNTKDQQRVTQLSLKLCALAQYSQIDYQTNQAQFLTELKLDLEPITNPAHYLPFKKQQFAPVEVEGLIISEARNSDDLSFDLEQDKSNQQIYYKISIP
ncbi:hypothetical protein ACR9PT_13880, partial [Piscirickettsia salmonis]|uniref:hypothetical protein n=1 Tax=Piscirickettsia salmonis TaxID=1238 RepID=UPI003EBB0D77